MTNINKINILRTSNNLDLNEVQLRKKLSLKEQKTYSVSTKPFATLQQYKEIPTEETSLTNTSASYSKEAKEYSNSALRAINR